MVEANESVSQQQQMGQSLPEIPEEVYNMEPTDAWLKISEQHEPKQPYTRLETTTYSEPGPKPDNHVRFVVISDTHSSEKTHPGRLVVPDGDVLLHTGDFTRNGGPQQIADFCDWFGAQTHPRKILIAGNHDLSLDSETYARTAVEIARQEPDFDTDSASQQCIKLIKSIPNCEYLLDSGTSVRGIQVWGSPWQPEFYNWGFNLQRGQPCREKWQLIPEQTDIILTHGPPLGHGDLCLPSRQRAGCLDLLAELQQRVKPKVHCFGHVHESYGVTTDGQTLYFNAASCDHSYKPINKPLVFDLPARD